MLSFVLGFLCSAALLNPVEAKWYALKILHGLTRAIEWITTMLA